MKVILNSVFKKLGAPGDIVDVKPGFARNYLLPLDFAVPATNENLSKLDLMKAAAEKAEVEKIKKAKVDKDRLLSILPVVIYRVASADGKLFGSVNSKDISSFFKDKGININRRSIVIPSLVKSLGHHDVIVEFHSEVKAEFTVEVVKQKS